MNGEKIESTIQRVTKQFSIGGLMAPLITVSPPSPPAPSRVIKEPNPNRLSRESSLNSRKLIKLRRSVKAYVKYQTCTLRFKAAYS